ncbi:hypothetical protein KFK09_018435 [Dendrobium nobile]|uniref:Uncharacterized protein n=1 Tax=Dendrobium nobile TaxID=94219 RepID=A0A8T3AUD4_DENNO|nr:hypothetical protein KFK09_018435 [Dendrobium nobile]
MNGLYWIGRKHQSTLERSRRRRWRDEGVADKEVGAEKAGLEGDGVELLAGANSLRSCLLERSRTRTKESKKAIVQ